MYGRRKRKASEQVVPTPPPLPSPVSTPHSSSPLTPRNPNHPIPDFQRIYDLMRSTEDGITLADRRWGLTTYQKCFIGSEAVKWMMSTLEFDRQKAVSTGQRLIEAGIIHHVTHSEPFQDDNFFYRFQEDDDGNCLNMKRVWDRQIPTGDPVTVSKTLLTKLALLIEEHRKSVLSPPTPQLKPSLPPTPTTPTLLARKTSSSPPFLTPSTPPLPIVTPDPITPTFPPEHLDDVDYSALAKSQKFRDYVLSAAELQRVHLQALTHHDRIAFFVNVYNALVLHAHVTHGPPNSLWRRYMFFRILSYRVAGLDFTLDDIEHGILRGNKRPPMIKFVLQLRASDPKCQHILTTREPRIHFLISAGTRSDPPIRILESDEVHEQLHHATVEFLTYTVKLDVEKRSVSLPRIFYWYAEDFPTPEKELLQWVAHHLPAETAHRLCNMLQSPSTFPTVTYKNFDWATAAARFNASVVRRKRRKLERERAPQEEAPLLGITFPIAGLFEDKPIGSFEDTPLITPTENRDAVVKESETSQFGRSAPLSSDPRSDSTEQLLFSTRRDSDTHPPIDSNNDATRTTVNTTNRNENGA